MPFGDPPRRDLKPFVMHKMVGSPTFKDSMQQLNNTFNALGSGANQAAQTLTFIDRSQQRYLTGSGTLLYDSRNHKITYFEPSDLDHLDNTPEQQKEIEDMKKRMDQLENRLRRVFNADLSITDWKDNRISLQWTPSRGSPEYGFFDKDDLSSVKITAYHNQPVSYEAWTLIFTYLSLFLDNQSEAMYLMEHRDWDGTMDNLFRMFTDLTVRYDIFTQQWNAKILNSDIGPVVFDNYDDDLLNACCKTATDVILFPDFLAQVKIHNEDDYTKTFPDWKGYIINAVK